MKKFFILCFLLSLVKLSSAQNTWCPQGATWYYSSVYGPPFLNAKVKVTYEKDSLFNTINCKYLKSEFTVESPVGLLGTSHYFTYENNKVVYLYNANGVFDTLFNFNATIGETWSRYIGWPGNIGDTNSCNFNRSLVTVIDTGSAIINSTHLKKLVLRYNVVFIANTAPYSFVDTVYEKLGSIIHGFKPILCESYYGMTDIGDYDTFRCYEDDAFGLYHKSGTPECDTIYSTNIKEINSSSIFTIFPNPSTGGVTIISAKAKKSTLIEVFTVLGEKILTKEINAGNDLKITDLKEGNYFIKIQVDNSAIYYTRLIIAK